MKPLNDEPRPKAGETLAKTDPPSVSSSRNEDSSVRGFWVTAYGYKQSPWVYAMVSAVIRQWLGVTQRSMQASCSQALLGSSGCLLLQQTCSDWA